MTPIDAAKVLAVASTYDRRHTPESRDDGEARAKAWAYALASDMTVKWAIEQVTRHYAESTDALMPAHLNAAWKHHTRPLKEAAERRRLLTEKGVPMPPEIRQRLHQLITKTGVPDA